MAAYGSRDPRRTYPGQAQLDKAFQDLDRAYRDEDPAPKAQHAIPNTTVRWIAQHTHYGNPQAWTTGRLIVLAYFFLLRVGEYTPATNKKRKKRTIPLRKCDVRLIRGGRAMDPEAPLHELLTATGVTTCLENQKNGHKDQTLFHDKSDDPDLCPVTTVAYLLDSMRGMPNDTPLGTYLDNGRRRQVTAAQVLAMVRLGADEDDLASDGYDLSRIGTHSLRAGGAVRLKMAGADDSIIKKLGRWSSDTYLRYIQPHIAPLTGGFARRMAVSLRFTNVFAR